MTTLTLILCDWGLLVTVITELLVRSPHPLLIVKVILSSFTREYFVNSTTVAMEEHQTTIILTGVILDLI